MNNPPLESLILTIRRQKVLLDADLAAIYGVPSSDQSPQPSREA